MTPLLTFKNAKTVKGEKLGYLTAILYLAPAKVSGFNVCPKATAGCKASCLYTAGQGIYHNVQAARIRKTVLFKTDRVAFDNQIREDILKARVRAAKLGLTLCIRPNGTSDIDSIARMIALENPDINIYGYTKIPEPWKRVLPNYDITFSRSENNTKDCLLALEHNINVAVVFNTKRKENLPKEFWGRKVLDCDLTDLRFNDEKGGLICGLRAKGKARYDSSGFVIHV